MTISTNSHKKFLFILLCSIMCFGAFAERVYDEYGRVLRSSEWLGVEQKKPKKTDSTAGAQDDPSAETSVPSQESAPVPQITVTDKNNFQISSDKNFSASDIEQSHAPSVSDFLQQQGLLVMSTGGNGSKSELSFKGFTAFCIKVYIDGVLANHPTTGEFDWNSIDINSIESITISEVPSIGITEFAGCTVFIKTKNGKKGFLTAETSLSSYESNFLDGIFQSLSYQGSEKNFFYRIAASAAFYDNEYAKYSVEYPTGSGNSFDIINLYNLSKQTNLNFAWNTKINEHISLAGSNNLGFNSLKVPNTSDTLSSGIERDLTTQNNIAVNLTFDKLKTTSLLSYFLGNVDYYDVLTESQRDISKTTSQAISFRQNLNWIFDATLGYRQEHLFSAQGDRHQLDLGIGKEHRWGWFSMTPNVSFINVWNDSKNKNQNWIWDIQPSLTLGFTDLYVSAYRIFTLPTFNQLYWPDSSYATGNPDLKAEKGWAASVWYKNPDFPLYGRFTYSYYENKIRWASHGGKLIPQNTANADYYVGTIGYEQEVWKNHLVIQADFTTTQARLRSTYKQIMWVPQYQAHASIAFEHSGFQAMLDYTFTSKRYTSNDNISAYPAFHLLDASIAYKINDEFTIYAKGSNLLDQHAAYHDGYYIPSRKWTLGMKFQR